MTDQLSLLPMLNELPEGKQGTFEALQESVRQNRKGDKVMNELKAIRSGEIYNIIEYEDCYRTDDLYYPKSEVDAAIEELKDDNRRLKRALWLARKAHAVAMFSYWDSHYRDNPNAVYRNRTVDWLRNRWLLILDAIIKKEKEYK